MALAWAWRVAAGRGEKIKPQFSTASRGLQLCPAIYALLFFSWILFFFLGRLFPAVFFNPYCFLLMFFGNVNAHTCGRFHIAHTP